ncbi:MAG: TolC family protein [Spirochaetaceae bacterium]|nr:TolC family protein [Spirochaetaceae bacterium]
MIKKRFFFPVILFMFILENLFCQQDNVVVLTVDEAVAYATENSKTLKSSAIDLEIKKRASDLVWNQFLPSVNLSATFSRSNEYTDSFSAIMSAINPMYQAPEVEESNHWMAIGNVGITWNFSFALVDGIRIIKSNYEAGLITWNQAVKQNELQIKKMFYGLLLQQENLALQKQSLVNAEQRVKQAQINYNNGRIPELQLLQTQVAYENKKPSVLKMEQAVNQQLDLFAFMLGMPSGTKVVLEGNIDPAFVELDAEQLIADNVSKNPDIVSLQKNLDILRLNLSVQNMQTFTPALQLSWGFQPVVSDITSNWLDTYMDNGAFSATLAWNLTNMLPFSTTRQAAKDTKANIYKLELALDTLLEKTELDIRTQIDALEQSKVSIEAVTKSINLAQKSYDMTLASYQNGTSELLDLRDAEDQLHQAQLGLMNEKYTYLSGLMDLEYMLNTNLINMPQGETNE